MDDEKLIENLTGALREKYPALTDNLNMLELGEALRVDIEEVLRRPDEPTPEPVKEGEKEPELLFTTERGKALEAKLSLYNKLADHIEKMRKVAGNIAGEEGEKAAAISDAPGAAQNILGKKKRNG